MELLALLLITTTDPVIYLTKILSWFGILVNVVQKQQRVTVENLLVSFGKQVREPTFAGFFRVNLKAKNYLGNWLTLENIRILYCHRVKSNLIKIVLVEKRI